MANPDMKTGPVWQDETSILNGAPEPFVRCARCGFICNTKRDHHSNYGSRDGWGMTYVRMYNEITITNGRVTNRETVA